MRSFGNREDVISILDEPLYAAYLKSTGKDHPMRDEVIASQDSNPDEVAKICTQSKGSGICYQKHMVQHLHNSFDSRWILQLTNCFLIRNPEEVVDSFLLKLPDAKFEDFGFDQQLNIFDLVARNMNATPLVIDATELRNNPENILKKVCDRLSISWDSRMLEWKSGLRSYDGVWAPHWYPSVESSTCFKKYKKSTNTFSMKVKSIIDKAMPSYEKLSAYKI
jgi:hypothetical protein